MTAVDTRETVNRLFAVGCAAAAVSLLVTLLMAGSAVGGQVETLYGPYRLADELPWMVVNTVTALAGAALVVRLPRNPIGWCLVGIGLGFLASATVAFVAPLGIDGAEATWWAYTFAWLRNWVWVAGPAGMLYLFLLFPTGTPLSPRWRRLGWGAGGVLSATAVLAAVHPRFESAPTLTNPIGIPAMAWLLEPLIGVMMALVAVALASLVVRFVRSHGVERHQLRWVAFGAVTVVAWQPLLMLGVAPRSTVVVGPLVMLAAIVVAVTRYRLYELDRIVSRTVSYVVLSVLLVGVYAAGVVGRGGLVRTIYGGGGDLVVAGSTLMVAALFGPARRRIQALVDRRFNRARYDAQRTVETFAQRLRDEVDLDALTDDLCDVVDRSMQPRAVSVWLAVEEARP